MYRYALLVVQVLMLQRLSGARNASQGDMHQLHRLHHVPTVCLENFLWAMPRFVLIVRQVLSNLAQAKQHVFLLTQDHMPYLDRQI